MTLEAAPRNGFGTLSIKLVLFVASGRVKGSGQAAKGSPAYSIPSGRRPMLPAAIRWGTEAGSSPINRHAVVSRAKTSVEARVRLVCFTVPPPGPLPSIESTASKIVRPGDMVAASSQSMRTNPAMRRQIGSVTTGHSPDKNQRSRDFRQRNGLVSGLSLIHI